MNIDEILKEIDWKLKSYQNNLILEDDFVMGSSKRLTNELSDLFNSYRINVNYEVLDNLIRTHLFFEHKGNKNKYERTIEEANLDLKKLARCTIEENLEVDKVNSGIEQHRSTVDSFNRGIVDRNLDDLYYNMVCTLKRNISFNNDDFWYQVNKILNNSKATMSTNVNDYRKQNFVILSNVEEIVKNVSLTVDKSNQIQDKIDKMLDTVKKNNQFVKLEYGKELSMMLNSQFSELSKEASLSVNGNQEIDINNLSSELLNSIAGEFSQEYNEFFDKVDTYLIPSLIQHSKLMISNKNTVNFSNDEKVKEEMIQFSSTTPNIIGLSSNSVDKNISKFNTNCITDLIAKKYLISNGDPRYQNIKTIVDKRMNMIDNYSTNTKNSIIESTALEIEKQANMILENTDLKQNTTDGTNLSSMFR